MIMKIEKESVSARLSLGCAQASPGLSPGFAWAKSDFDRAKLGQSPSEALAKPWFFLRKAQAKPEFCPVKAWAKPGLCLFKTGRNLGKTWAFARLEA